MAADWPEVRATFEAALERHGQEREAFLDAACQEDPALRPEVDRLLEAAEGMGAFLETPAAEGLGLSRPEPERREVGPYRILERLGEGGMGVVYLAVRKDADYLPPVALKVIRHNLGSGPLRCFEAERRIMASLDHPRIARLLDGGSTEDGLPYYVMEYVPGERMDRWVRNRAQPMEARLRVLLEVCDAVGHAHRHLVVHRDLKPSNILVTEDGHAKLLDFGIAKLLEPAPPAPGSTGTLVHMLTPDYASPEQAKGEAITTATDVYSLGVLLYELLTDSRPYDVDTLTPVALAQAICEQEPRRGGAFARLPRDLGCVVLKAMRKEPSERYASVDQLAEDLRRFLAGLPVEARRGSRAYYVGKYLRKYKRTALAAAAVLVAILVGGAATLWQARVALRQRALAERRCQDLRNLATSLVLELDEAIVDLQGTMPARELAIRRACDYLVALERETSPDESLQRELAMALIRMGELQRRTCGFSPHVSADALQHFQKALEIRRRLAVAHPSSLEDQDALADVHWRLARLLGQSGDAEAHLAHAREAVALHERLCARTPGWTEGPFRLAADYQTLGNAQLHLGDGPGAMATFQKVAAFRSAMASAPKADPMAQAQLAAAHRNLARAMVMTGDPKGARRVLERTLALQERLAAGHATNVWLQRDLLRTRNQYGRLLSDGGETSRAELQLRRGTRLADTLLAANPRNAEVRLRSAEAYSDLGLHLLRTHRASQARSCCERALHLLDGWSQELPGKAQVALTQAEALERLGRACRSTGREVFGTDCLRRSLALLDGLKAQRRLPADLQERPEELRRLLEGRA